MKSHLFSRRACRVVLILLLSCSWLSIGAFSGCDPAVSSAILEGVEGATLSLSDALIQATFEALEPEDRTPLPVDSGTGT